MCVCRVKNNYLRSVILILNHASMKKVSCWLIAGKNDESSPKQNQSNNTACFVKLAFLQEGIFLLMFEDVVVEVFDCSASGKPWIVLERVMLFFEVFEICLFFLQFSIFPENGRSSIVYSEARLGVGGVLFY